MGRTLLLSLAVLAAPVPASAQAANGDAGRGQRVFQRCFACHSVVPGEIGLPGPNLFGIVGRRAGWQEGFEYSDALRRSGLVWDEHALDALIVDPSRFLPGTLMAMPGLEEEADRRDVIAYLKAQR